MTDFFDWLTAADSGLGVDRLADAFNLSRDEFRGTTDALAPAFAVALRRAMADPEVWQDLAKRFVPLMGQTTAPGPETAQSTAAKAFSDTLFGSADISSAIARKVSLANGVAPDAVEQLMRNLSVMTMQTMVQMMLANVARSQPKGLAEGDYPTAMAEMMRRGANAMEALGRPSDARSPRKAAPFVPSSEALAELFSNALTGRVPFLPPEVETPAAPQSRRQKPQVEPAAQPEAARNPFEAIMDGFMRGMAGSSLEGPNAASARDGGLHKSDAADANDTSSQSAAEPTESVAAADNPKTRETAAGGYGAFDDLARAGRQMQDDYARQFTELFGTDPVRNGAAQGDASKPRR